MKRNSSSKNKRPRVYAFIDAENMRNAAEAYDYFDLDYEKMYFWLKKKKVYNFLVTEKHIKITVYSPIKKGIKITSTKVKEMASSGMIKLEDLGCILFNYGLKQIVVS